MEPELDDLINDHVINPSATKGGEGGLGWPQKGFLA